MGGNGGKEVRVSHSVGGEQIPVGKEERKRIRLRKGKGR